MPLNKSVNLIFDLGFLILTVKSAFVFKTVSSDKVSQKPSYAKGFPSACASGFNSFNLSSEQKQANAFY